MQAPVVWWPKRRSDGLPQSRPIAYMFRSGRLPLLRLPDPMRPWFRPPASSSRSSIRRWSASFGSSPVTSSMKRSAHPHDERLLRECAPRFAATWRAPARRPAPSCCTGDARISGCAASPHERASGGHVRV